jgi:uncharacterized membrane protein YsdA (DUF1294 family)
MDLLHGGTDGLDIIIRHRLKGLLRTTACKKQSKHQEYPTFFHIFSLQKGFTMKQLLVCLLLVNAVGLLLMRTDKNNARKKLWRIPENILLVTAFFGGSLGLLLGIYLFRHKTTRKKFTVTVPLLFLIHGIILLYLYL